MLLTTLCYIENADSYLMLHRIKKKADVNKDKWLASVENLKKAKCPEDCLLREAREETGLTLTDYRLRGVLTFICDPWESECIFLYTATGYEGKLTDCPEGTLEWVRKDEIHKLNLWEGDKIFFKLLNENYPVFSLKLVYENGDQLTEAVLDGRKLKIADYTK